MNKVRSLPRFEPRIQPKHVDPAAVRRAFAVWDADADGRIDVRDLLRFVGALQAPRGGWPAFAKAMVAEAVSRTGFLYPAGRQHGQVLRVDDVIKAVALRRPYRDTWILFLTRIENRIFKGPDPVPVAPPAATYRERMAMRPATAPKKGTSKVDLAVRPKTSPVVTKIDETPWTTARAESRIACLNRLSLGGARHVHGKSHQACFDLTEPLPYVHTARVDDPAGQDRRSRLHVAYNNLARPRNFDLITSPSTFALHPLHSPHDPPIVDYSRLARQAAFYYDQHATHPERRGTANLRL